MAESASARDARNVVDASTHPANCLCCIGGPDLSFERAVFALLELNLGLEYDTAARFVRLCRAAPRMDGGTIDYVAGFFASAISTSAVYPVETYKVRLQTGSAFEFGGDESPFALLRGIELGLAQIEGVGLGGVIQRGLKRGGRCLHRRQVGPGTRITRLGQRVGQGFEVLGDPLGQCGECVRRAAICATGGGLEARVQASL